MHCTTVASEIKGLEIGAVEPINGTYYALLGAYTYPEMGDLGGMYVAKAHAVEGPYTVDEGAYRLLTTRAHRDTYFTRFFRDRTVYLSFINSFDVMVKAISRR